MPLTQQSLDATFRVHPGEGTGFALPGWLLRQAVKPRLHRFWSVIRPFRLSAHHRLAGLPEGPAFL